MADGGGIMKGLRPEVPIDDDHLAL
jgi:hypothetical protein